MKKSDLKNGLEEDDIVAVKGNNLVTLWSREKSWEPCPVCGKQVEPSLTDQKHFENHAPLFFTAGCPDCMTDLYIYADHDKSYDDNVDTIRRKWNREGLA